MNNRILAFFFVLALLMPMALKAQTETALNPELGARLSLVADWRITRGLHLFLEEEARFDNNFGSFNRLQTTLGLDYKVHPNIKLGLGYALINVYSVDNKAFKYPRHRFLADVTGTLHFNYWNFSLKERFQVTRRTGNYNVYQNPKNALTLKSRMTAKYKGFNRVEPYAYVEIRNYLNAPVIYASYDGTGYYTLEENPSETGDPGWFLYSFKGGYINRVRGSIGMDFKIDKRNSFNIYILTDYIMDKVIDANAEGTKLKSYTKESGFVGWIGAGYEYSF